jgi:hypothetical protein
MMEPKLPNVEALLMKPKNQTPTVELEPANVDTVLKSENSQVCFMPMPMPVNIVDAVSRSEVCQYAKV